MCVPMYVTCQVVYAVRVLHSLCVVHVCMHYTVYVCCTCLYVHVCKVQATYKSVKGYVTRNYSLILPPIMVDE